MEESTDPGNENPQDDNDKECRSDRVHDSFEMALVFGALNESSCAANERSSCISRDDTISFSAFAAGSVVAGVAHVFIDGERFTSDSGLITSNERYTMVIVTLVIIIASLFLLLRFLTLLFSHKLFILIESVGVVISADKAGIGWYNLPFFNDDLQLLNKYTI